MYSNFLYSLIISKTTTFTVCSRNQVQQRWRYVLTYNIYKKTNVEFEAYDCDFAEHTLIFSTFT